MKQRLISEIALFTLFVFMFSLINFLHFPSEVAADYHAISDCPWEEGDLEWSSGESWNSSQGYCSSCITESNAQSIIDSCVAELTSLAFSFESIQVAAADCESECLADNDHPAAGEANSIFWGAVEATAGAIAAAKAAGIETVGKLTRAGCGLGAVMIFRDLENRYWDDIARLLYKHCTGCNLYIRRGKKNKFPHKLYTCTAETKDYGTCGTRYYPCGRIKAGLTTCPTHYNHYSCSLPNTTHCPDHPNR